MIHQRRVPLVLLAAMALALSGCGSSTTSDASTTSSASAASGSPAASSAGTDTTAASAGSSAGSDSSAASAGSSAGSETSDAQCDVSSLNLYSPGVLTPASGTPGYAPWYIDGEPSNGKGFEGSLVFAVAEKMGFKHDEVQWVRSTFKQAIAPGPKSFDFYSGAVAINDVRKKAVTFSQEYHSEPLVVLVKEGSPVLEATSIADLKKYKFGALSGSTFYSYITDQIQPDQEMYAYDTNAASAQALSNGTVDAIVESTQIGSSIVNTQVEGLVISGTLPDSESPIGFVFDKDNPLATCVDKALDSLKADGTVQKLSDTWLAQTTGLMMYTK